MFSCEKAAKLMSDGLERPLGFHEKCSMHLHMAICSTCRRYKRQIEFLDRILKKHFRAADDATGSGRAPNELDLGPRAKDRIKQAIISSGG